MVSAVASNYLPFARVLADSVREQHADARVSVLVADADVRPPGEEPWVFVDIEGRDVPTEALNGRLPGFPARFNQVDASFFEMYQVPTLIGRGFAAGDVATFPGKLKLIATGFGEACVAVNYAKHFLDPAANIFPGHSSNLKK